MIYLDNSATTRIDEEVLEAMLPWLRDDFGNASSIYASGRKARVAVEDAREEIASLINAHPAEIYFTSGGTESNNTILKSSLIESGLADRLFCSSIEHHAVLYPVTEMQRRGFETGVLPVDHEGRIIRSGLNEGASARTLFSTMHANNETGVVQDLKSLREEIPSAYLHSDAVQSFGKIPLDVKDLALDFASFSAHKIHGPKGIGAIFIRRGIDFKAHQQGGAQERNRRAGTEPVALIIGFQRAARLAYAEMELRAQKMSGNISLLRKLLPEKIPHIRFNTPESGSLPNILNVSFIDAEKLDGEAILQMMDMRGIAVSNGSACVSGSLQPSHVLKAIGLSDPEARAGVRFSVSKDTTGEEVIAAADALAEILEEMRS